MRISRHDVRSRGGLVAVAGATALQLMLSAAEAQPLAYVTNLTSGAITEINTLAQQVSGSIPLSIGTFRLNAKVSPDGRRLYIGSPDSISVVDTATGRVVDTIQGLHCDTNLCSVGALDLTPDGAFLYVTNLLPDPSPRSDAVTVIETATHRTVASIPVGPHPNQIVVGPDGFAYVALESSNAVAVIDTAARSVVNTFQLPNAPAVIAVTPGGRFVYVGTWSEADRSIVEVFDTHANALVAHVVIPRVPQGIAVTPDGRFVYVSSTSGVISVIDTTTNAVVATIPAPGAQRLVVSPDGRFAYVSAGNILVIDTGTNTVVATVAAGAEALAISPDSQRLYVATPWASPGISVIDTAARRVVSTIPDTDSMDSIALLPNGRFAYVASFFPQPSSVLVIDLVAKRVAEAIPVDELLGIMYRHQLRVVASPDGRVVYVSGNPVAVIDTALNAITATIALPGAGEAVAIAFSPDSSRAYAIASRNVEFDGAPFFPWAILTIDTAAGTVLSEQPIQVNAVPVDIAVAPNGRSAYLAMQPAPRPHRAPRLPGAIAVIDLTTGNVQTAFPYSSEKIVFDPTSALAYVATDSDAVAIIDTAAQTITSWVQVGFPQRTIAVSPDGRWLYVAGFDSTVSIIDTTAKRVATTLFVGGLVGEVTIANVSDLVCTGDCNGDGKVTVDELLRMVNIALSSGQATACGTSQSGQSRAMTVTEIISAVKNALNGC